MAYRSPWADSRLNVCLGADLPPLLHHHRRRVPDHEVRSWRPVVNHLGTNRPLGGLWSAPWLKPSGVWRPIPRESTWSQWCAYEFPEAINVRAPYITQVHPQPAASFAVIDSAADARALYDVFPAQSPRELIAQLLGNEPPEADKEMRIDWSGLLNRHLAGVYLTDRGQHETRMPDDPGQVPSLWGWDVATVWFSQADAFTLGRTWRAPHLPSF